MDLAGEPLRIDCEAVAMLREFSFGVLVVPEDARGLFEEDGLPVLEERHSPKDVVHVAHAVRSGGVHRPVDDGAGDDLVAIALQVLEVLRVRLVGEDEVHPGGDEDHHEEACFGHHFARCFGAGDGEGQGDEEGSANHEDAGPLGAGHRLNPCAFRKIPDEL